MHPHYCPFPLPSVLVHLTNCPKALAWFAVTALGATSSWSTSGISCFFLGNERKVLLVVVVVVVVVVDGYLGSVGGGKWNIIERRCASAWEVGTACGIDVGGVWVGW